MAAERWAVACIALAFALTFLVRDIKQNMHEGSSGVSVHTVLKDFMRAANFSITYLFVYVVTRYVLGIVWFTVSYMCAFFVTIVATPPRSQLIGNPNPIAIALSSALNSIVVASDFALAGALRVLEKAVSTARVDSVIWCKFLVDMFPAGSLVCVSLSSLVRACVR